MLLVVGATGQLGSLITRKALERGHAVRALARPSSRFEPLQEAGAEIALGDLRDAASLEAACAGVKTVISTATVVFPRGDYDFERDEGLGYQNLIDACKNQGVSQLVFISNLAPDAEPYLRRAPTIRLKRRVEQMIVKSGLHYTTFRASLFMDDYFALIGSDLPLRGAEAATLLRPFGPSLAYVRSTGRLIDRFGIALVPGSPGDRHSFIALQDVAEYMLRSVGNPAALDRCFEIGGPAALSWNEVCELFSVLLGRRVRPFNSPSWSYRLLSDAARPFSAATANQMALLWLISRNEIVADDRDAVHTFDFERTSARAFLENKLGCPP